MSDKIRFEFDELKTKKAEIVRIYFRWKSTIVRGALTELQTDNKRLQIPSNVGGHNGKDVTKRGGPVRNDGTCTPVPSRGKHCTNPKMSFLQCDTVTVRFSTMCSCACCWLSICSQMRSDVFKHAQVLRWLDENGHSLLSLFFETMNVIKGAVAPVTPSRPKRKDAAIQSWNYLKVGHMKGSLWVHQAEGLVLRRREGVSSDKFGDFARAAALVPCSTTAFFLSVRPLSGNLILSSLLRSLAGRPQGCFQRDRTQHLPPPNQTCHVLPVSRSPSVSSGLHGRQNWQKSSSLDEVLSATLMTSIRSPAGKAHSTFRPGSFSIHRKCAGCHSQFPSA